MSDELMDMDPETRGHADTEPTYSELLAITPKGSEDTYA